MKLLLFITICQGMTMRHVKAPAASLVHIEYVPYASNARCISGVGLGFRRWVMLHHWMGHVASQYGTHWFGFARVIAWQRDRRTPSSISQIVKARSCSRIVSSADSYFIDCSVLHAWVRISVEAVTFIIHLSVTFVHKWPERVGFPCGPENPHIII